MKRLVFAAILFIACFLTVSAQDNFQPEWAFGANAGMTFSSVKFTPAVTQRSLSQFAGGVTARYISEKHFGLQGELNLSQRGWKEQKDSIPDHKYTKSLLYVELPVMTHIYFNLGSQMRVLFNLGPQISYLVSEKVLEKNVIDDPGTDPNYRPTQYSTNIENKFDWGIAAGGGFEFRTGVGSFVLEGRYFYGLSDIYNNRKVDYFSTSSNQVGQVKLTYFYRR